MNKTKVRSCIISSEIVGPFNNGGIGTHCYYLAEFLSKQEDQEVTFLYTGEIENQNEDYWRKWFHQHLNISFVWLSSVASSPSPATLGLPCHHAHIARKVFH